MTDLTIESLGLSADDILDRVVDQVALKLIDESDFVARLEERVIEKVNASIDELGAANVIPSMKDFIDGYTIQETTKWGEKKGEPVTFTEYLVERAHAWIQEPVNYAGKTKPQDSYNWKANTTRVAYLIDQHLQYHITRTMKEALGEAQGKIAEGITQAVRIQLKNMVVHFKASTEVKERR